MIVKGKATVVKHTGSHYMLSQLPQWDLFPAVLRGKIRLKGSSATNPVAVGDVVDFEAELPEDAGFESIAEYVTLENPAAITGVHKRRNYVIRKSTNLSRQSHIIAANLDRAFIIATIDYPEIKLPFLDRILVTCEVYNIPVTIVLNKVDLYRESHAEMLEAFHEIYEGAGYPVMEVSALTGEGVDALREACSGHVSLFSGVSGVGKSSLIKETLMPVLKNRFYNAKMQPLPYDETFSGRNRNHHSRLHFRSPADAGKGFDRTRSSGYRSLFQMRVRKLFFLFQSLWKIFRNNPNRTKYLIFSS